MKQTLDTRRIDMASPQTLIDEPDTRQQHRIDEILNRLSDYGIYLDETTVIRGGLRHFSNISRNYKLSVGLDGSYTCSEALDALLKAPNVKANTAQDRPVEGDPHGKDPHTPGAKLDAGKNRLGLVMHGFAKALEEVGRVGTFGANKYTDNGWVSVPNGVERYTDAQYRHLLKEAQGEVTDPDSQLLHAAHGAWNALARLELILRRLDN